MIQQIKNVTPYAGFIRGFYSDRRFFAQPKTEKEVLEKLQKQSADPDNIAFAAFCGEKITGLFVFLYLKEEKYMEMLTGISVDPDAYDMMLSYFCDKFPEHEIYFVFNPENELLKSRLQYRGAEFTAEQMKMAHSGAIPPCDTDCVKPLTSEYYDQYIEMHNKDVYWTGDKVIKAKEKFKTFIVNDGSALAGYIDITYGRAENGIFDLLVKPEYRRKGCGRKLLIKALRINEPNGMRLEVDIDNIPAINLYYSADFHKIEHQNVLTVLLKTYKKKKSEKF